MKDQKQYYLLKRFFVSAYLMRILRKAVAFVIQCPSHLRVDLKVIRTYHVLILQVYKGL